jgi:hypothetical protein
MKNLSFLETVDAVQSVVLCVDSIAGFYRAY